MTNKNTIKLQHKNDYLSITKFNDIELNEFTVLTGVNGSGKSQLLQAIDQKKVIIEGYERSNIVLFNYENFKLENENSFHANAISQEKQSAWNFFNQASTSINIKNSIRSWKNQLGTNYQTITSLCEEKNKNLFSLSKEDISDDAVFNLLKAYRNNIENYFKNNNSLKNNQQAKAILALIKKLPYSIDEIKQEGFLKLYKPFSFKNDFLPQQLGKIIWDYYIKYDKNEYNEYQNKEKGKNHSVLSYSDFIKQHGEKPWETINKRLSEFTGLKYTINSPEGKFIDEEFQLKLIHKDKDLEIGFEHLSSGERILMALVASIYKSSSDNHFPDILLLDEVDTSLHPSMIKNLLSVIENTFLKKEIKVILVTHSPSTIAFAPPDSIFVMNNSGEKRIEKQSQQQALNILSEGFVSLSSEDSNLGISYNISKSDLPVLFTEGITDKIILETAWKKLNKNEEQPFYIQDCFSSSFLGNLFKNKDSEIFKNYPDRTFLALFDFDFAGYNQWSGFKKSFSDIEDNPKKCLTKKHKSKNAYAILLPAPDSNVKNQVIKNEKETFKNNSVLDIELLFYGFDSSLDEKFFTAEAQAGGAKIIKFTGDKTKFANKVKELPPESFKNFEALFNKITSILNLIEKNENESE